MNLTSRQRIEKAFLHQQVDRTPMFEYVLLSPLADIFLRRAYAGDPANWETFLNQLGWEKAVRQNAIDRVELAIILGHDLIYATPNPLPPKNEGDFILNQPGTGEDPVENLCRRNAWNADHLGVDDDSLLIYRFLQQEMNHRSVDLPILAPAYAHGVWTDVDLMQTMALEPEVARRHFQLATSKSLALIEKYIQLGIDLVGIGGDFSGTRPLISPAFYRFYILPELQILSSRLHAAGLYAVNASDGDLWPVIDDFLIHSGVDGYLEIDLHASMDLPRLINAYGDRITFLGNLDCGIELSFGTPGEVRQHTLDCLEAGWGSGGHILCASNAITASVPLENYLAVISAYRDFFALDRFEFTRSG
jgi:hypothetical protein